MNESADTGAGSDGIPYRILVVDDEPSHRWLVQDILEPPRYDVHAVASAAQAMALLAQLDFDVVLADRQMPGMDGDALCRCIRVELQLPLLPVLMVTGSMDKKDLAASLRAGADDFISKPYYPLELKARIDAAVQRKRVTDQLDSAESMLFALARMVESKDTTTGDHCSRLSVLSVRLGEALGLSAHELMALRRGGVLHDIGKLGIPDAVLMKPGQLNEREWTVMRQHTVIGERLVSQLKTMRLTAPIIRHHHERFDGSGYPDGLRGEQIPLLARVFQVADIYDALLHARPYKPPMLPQQALHILQEETQRGWRDPAVVATFSQMILQAPLPPSASGASNEDLGITLYRSIVAAASA